MQLDKFIIGILMFSLVIVGGFFVFEGISDSYDLDIDKYDAGYNDTFDISEELYGNVGEIKNATLYSEVEGGDQNWESLIKASYKSITLVPKSINLLFNMINEVAVHMGIPSWLLTFLFAIIMISVIFGIIYMIFRYK